MALRIVGAGLGRTGTNSLKLALEHLLGKPCYHMLEVIEHPDHIPVWQKAVDGALPNWGEFLAVYGAAVDWPPAAFWKELAEANPEAIVLLSVRDDPEKWWQSAERTIFEIAQREPPAGTPMVAQRKLVVDLFTRFCDRWYERDAAIAAYQRHNDEVRSTVDPHRLVEWRPGQEWEPICEALGVPVPDRPFPHANTTAEFRAMVDLDAPDPSRSPAAGR